MHHRNNKFKLSLALVCYSSLGFSLSSDQQKRMYIKASSVEIVDAKGISKYSGPVTVKQGSMRITAKTVIVFHNKKRKIIKITAYGRPATYKVRPDKEPYDLISSANRLEYYPTKNLMDMFGNARVKQGSRDFKSPRIKYNLATNKVEAGTRLAGQKKPKANGGVSITITPNKKKSNNKKKKN